MKPSPGKGKQKHNHTKYFKAICTLFHKVFTQTLSHLMTTITLGNRQGKNYHPHFTDKVLKHKKRCLGSCCLHKLMSSHSDPSLISVTITHHHFQGHSKVEEDEWHVDPQGSTGSQGKKLWKVVSVWYTKALFNN